MLAYDRLALDRGSIRTVDKDGRLRVGLTPISSAVVSPYLGKEIPGFEELGLDADAVYNLLRDPAELARAVKSFEHLPLLSEHVPVDSVNYAPELVVGATGTDAVFQNPILYNTLTVWAQPAIDLVIDGTKKELSCAYHYTPVMQSGSLNGVSYDGRMVDLVGNHVAIVVEARVPGSVIGDSMPDFERQWRLISEAIFSL